MKAWLKNKHGMIFNVFSKEAHNWKHSQKILRMTQIKQKQSLHFGRMRMKYPLYYYSIFLGIYSFAQYIYFIYNPLHYPYVADNSLG